MLAGIGAAGCFVAGKTGVALAVLGLILFVFVVRHRVLSTMDHLRDAIGRGDIGAVHEFRLLHIAGMMLNVVQLASVAWAMTRLAT